MSPACLSSHRFSFSRLSMMENFMLISHVQPHTSLGHHNQPRGIGTHILFTTNIMSLLVFVDRN
jgi:hypothetical protein